MGKGERVGMFQIADSRLLIADSDCRCRPADQQLAIV